jgi:hypothetical protein
VKPSATSSAAPPPLLHLRFPFLALPTCSAKCIKSEKKNKKRVFERHAKKKKQKQMWQGKLCHQHYDEQTTQQQRQIRIDTRTYTHIKRERKKEKKSIGLRGKAADDMCTLSIHKKEQKRLVYRRTRRISAGAKKKKSSAKKQKRGSRDSNERKEGKVVKRKKWRSKEPSQLSFHFFVTKIRSHRRDGGHGSTRCYCRCTSRQSQTHQVGCTFLDPASSRTPAASLGLPASCTPH